MNRPDIFTWIVCAAIVLTTVACGTPLAPRPSLKDAPTHERYTAALSEFGLDNVALGRDWLAAASLALTQPIAASTPFAETGHLTAERPIAVGYRIDLARGRRLAIDVVFDTPEPGRLFVDLFELREGQSPRRVGGAEPGATSFEHDVRWSGPHVLRLQPELLRGGRYSISQRTLASYIFPLRERSLSGVSSGFGAPRDAGARDHHGIDIFAPRGTPVIAIADGTARTDETPRGGRVIWLHDPRRGRNLYYAHLHDWAVESGAQVRAGDVIGYVGNTGNAKTTPPHLHFGIYERGPADPAPYLNRDDPAPARVTAPVEPLGDWMRVKSTNAEVRVMAARRGEYRVRFKDGAVTWLRPRDLGAAGSKDPAS
jgi:murein DD-endopeptidase MepM/ murein hydrolase activator NlpD